ncbi:RNA-directed DNA polymerase, eukaryota, reverse transcriptase zinc-binding domain protein [Tanacetum coccineum]
MDVDFGPKPFRVFDVWLKEADMGNVVLRGWNKEQGSHEMRTRAESRTLDDEERLKWLEARRLWIDKEREKACMLRQKSRVSSIDANMLENPFEEKEVWEAVKSYGGDKALGPDGKEISRGCNSSFMALIPKVADPIGLSEYRPISLIGGYYKIIAKILAERIKLVIGKLVGEVQNAFIGERFILNGILIANETVDFVKKNKRKGLIFKVDFKKAYDSINWKMIMCNIPKDALFQDKVELLEFEACLESSSMSVLVNGSLTVEFGLERDVRQGDPLSSFLFILAAKGLNSMIKEAVDKVSGGLEVDGVGSRVGRSRLWCDIVKEDRWVGDIRLRERFPRDPRGRAYGDVVELTNLLQNVTLSLNCMDSWLWNLSEDGNFNVKDLAFMVYDICLHVGNTTQKTLWNKLAPKKVNVFIWRVLHGRIPVHVELDERGIELDYILCPCCDDSLESCDHCLVPCNVAKNVWDRIFEWWKISPINVFLANDLFRFSGNVDVERYSRDLWQLLRALTRFRGDQRNLPSIGRNGSSIRQAAEFSDGTVKLFVTCVFLSCGLPAVLSRNKVLVANPLPKKSPYGIKGGRPRVKKGEQRTKVFP